MIRGFKVLVAWLVLITAWSWLTILHGIALAAEPSEEILTIPSSLHIYSPAGEPIGVSFRSLSLDEVAILLKSDESDEGEEKTLKFWEQNSNAYYRWDLSSAAEIGLINDLAKNYGMLRVSNRTIDPSLLPRAVVAKIGEQERIVAIGGAYQGDVIFHSDAELRKAGYKGIGTALVADYLVWCFQQNVHPSFDAVNNSYQFYQKLGFIYSDPQHTPESVFNPANDRFAMHLPFEEISKILLEIKKNDAVKFTKSSSQESIGPSSQRECSTVIARDNQ